jgi:chromosome segregation ATPase
MYSKQYRSASQSSQPLQYKGPKDRSVTQRYLRTTSAPFASADSGPREESYTSNSNMIASGYSGLKRYPTVIEEVFVLREENDEVSASSMCFVSLLNYTYARCFVSQLRKRIIRYETELTEEKEFSKTAADYIGRLKAERDQTLTVNPSSDGPVAGPNGEASQSETNGNIYGMSNETVEDLIDNVRETLRSAAEEELKYKNEMLIQQSEEALELEKLASPEEIRRSRFSEKVSVFSKPKAADKAGTDRQSISAPVTPLVSTTGNKVPPASASKQVVNDIRNQLKKAKSLRNEDLMNDNANRLDASNQIGILAWQRQRNQYMNDIVDLSRKLSDWQNNLGNMSTAYRSLTEKVGTFAYSAEKVSFLTEDLNHLRREHGNLRDQIRESEARYVKNTNHVRVCLEALIESQKDIDDLKEQVTTLERERDSLIDEAQNTSMKYSIQISELNESHRKALMQMERELSKLRDQVVILEQEKSKLVDKLSAHVSDLAISQSQALAESAQDIESMREQVRILQQERASFLESDEASSAKIIALSQQLALVEDSQRKSSAEAELVIEALRLQVKTLQQEKSQMSERLNLVMQGQKNSVGNALSKAESEIKDLQNTQKEAQLKIISLTSQLTQLEDQHRRQIEEASQIISQCKEEIELLEQEKEELELQFQVKSKAFSSQLAEIEKIQMVDKQLTTLVTEQQKTITESERDLQDLKRKLLTLEKEREQEIRESQEQCQVLAKQVAELENKERDAAAIATAKLEAIEIKSRELEMAKLLAEERVALLSSQVASLQAEIQQKKTVVVNTTSKPSSSAAAANNAAVVQLEKQLQDVQEQLDLMKKEKFEIQITSSEQEARVKSLTSQLQELQDNRRKELRGIDLKMQSFNQRIEQLNSEKSSALSRVEELSQELADLRLERANVVEELRAEVSGLKDEINILLQEKISLEKAFHAKSDEMNKQIVKLQDGYVEKVSRLESEMLACREQIALVHTEKAAMYDESTKRIEELKIQMTEKMKGATSKDSMLSMFSSSNATAQQKQLEALLLEKVSYEEKMTILTAQIGNQAEQLKNQTTRIMELEKAIVILNEQISALQEEKMRVLEDSSKQIAALNSKVDELHAIIASLEGKLADSVEAKVFVSSSQENDSLVMNLQKQLSEVEQEKSTIEQASKAKVLQLNKMLHSLALEVSQRKEAEVKATADLEAMRNEYGQLLSQKSSMEQEYLSSMSKHSSHKYSISANGSSKVAASKEDEDVDEISVLQQKLTLLEQMNATMKQEMANIASQHQAEMVRHQDHQKKAQSEYEREIRANRDKIDTLYKEKERLEEEYLRTMDGMNKVEVERREALQALEEQREHANFISGLDSNLLQQENEQLKMQIANVTKEKDDSEKEYIETLSKLVRQLYVDSQFRSRAEPELESLHQQVDKLTADLQAKDEELVRSRLSVVDYQDLTARYESLDRAWNDQLALNEAQRLASKEEIAQLKDQMKQLQQSRKLPHQISGQLSALKESQARLLRETEVYKRQLQTQQQEKLQVEKEYHVKIQKIMKSMEEEHQVVLARDQKIKALRQRLLKYKKGKSFDALEKYKKSLLACAMLADIALEGRHSYYQIMSDLEEYNNTIAMLHERNVKIEDVLQALREEVVHGEYQVLRTRPSSKSIESFERALASRRQAGDMLPGWISPVAGDFKIQIQANANKINKSNIPAQEVVIPTPAPSPGPRPLRPADPLSSAASSAQIVKPVTRSAPGLNLHQMPERAVSPLDRSRKRDSSPVLSASKDKKKDKDKENMNTLQTLGAFFLPNAADSGQVEGRPREQSIWNISTSNANEALNGMQSWFANPLLFGQNESSSAPSTNPLALNGGNPLAKKRSTTPPPSAVAPATRLRDLESDYSYSYDSFEHADIGFEAHHAADSATATTIGDGDVRGGDADESDKATSIGDDAFDAHKELDKSLNVLLDDLASSRMDMTILQSKIEAKIVAATELQNKTIATPAPDESMREEQIVSAVISLPMPSESPLQVAVPPPLDDEVPLSLLTPQASNLNFPSSTASSSVDDFAVATAEVSGDSAEAGIHAAAAISTTIVKDENIERFRAEIEALLVQIDQQLLQIHDDDDEEDGE